MSGVDWANVAELTHAFADDSSEPSEANALHAAAKLCEAMPEIVALLTAVEHPDGMDRDDVDEAAKRLREKLGGAREENKALRAEHEKLIDLARDAYSGWAGSQDVVGPMHRLRAFLVESPGFTWKKP